LIISKCRHPPSNSDPTALMVRGFERGLRGFERVSKVRVEHN
jgi:hypothetical protein